MSPTVDEVKRDLRERLSKVPGNQDPRLYMADCLEIMVDIIAEALARAKGPA